MSIIEKININFISAMKERRETELSILRMLRAALKNKQIELMRELKEEDVLAVLRTQIKQLKDVLPSFETAGRTDLADKTKAELVILEGYLPAEMTDEELEKTVREVLSGAGIASKAESGKAIGAVMKAVAGRASGNRVKEWVEKILIKSLFFSFFCWLLARPAILAAAAAPGRASTKPKTEEPWLTSAFSSLSFSLSDISPDLIWRGLRVVATLFGILFINILLAGAFRYAVSSGRDDVVVECRREIIIGLLGTAAMLCLFFIASATLS